MKKIDVVIPPDCNDQQLRFSQYIEQNFANAVGESVRVEFDPDNELIYVHTSAGRYTHQIGSDDGEFIFVLDSVRDPDAFYQSPDNFYDDNFDSDPKKLWVLDDRTIVIPLPPLEFY